MEEPRDIESMTPADCQGEIDATLEDAEHAYWGKPGSGPSHTKAVERMRALHQRIYGDKDYDGLTEKLKEEGVKTEEDMQKIREDAEEDEEEEEVPLTPEQEEGFKKLKEEWGSQYDAHLSEAQGAYQGIIRLYGKDNPEFVHLMESSLGNEPCVIKLFAELGRQAREDLERGFTCPKCGEKITEEEE